MTAPSNNIVQLQVGDTVPIGTALLNLILMGIVTDVNNPNMFGATLQAYKSQAVLTVPVLQGDQGPPGNVTFALQFQNDTLTQVSQLPQNLNNTTDLGKYWVFGVTDQNDNVVATEMQVWYGSVIGFKAFPVGTPGPPGAYPLITPNIVLQVPGSGNGPNGVDSWIDVSGSVSNPTFTFNIAAPIGPVGPPGSLGTSPDVDYTNSPPQPGDVLTCTSRVTPGAPTNLTPLPSSTGGALAAGSWFYQVTTILSNGESLPSNEVEATTIGGTSSVLLTWNAPSGGGGIGYNVYRGNYVTGVSTLVGTVNGISATTFTDVGSAGKPGAPPSVGAVAGRPIWGPATQSVLVPKLYTVPQSAFQGMAGVGGTRQTVCTYAIPPQPWPWKPFVLGSMKILGLNISFTPLLVGADVMLGDPSTGTLVARGQGNSLGTVVLIPNTANSSNPSQAITPDNSVALVPANHTGNQGTLYVNLENQGMAGVYDYNPAGSSLMVLVCPVVP